VRRVSENEIEPIGDRSEAATAGGCRSRDALPRFRRKQAGDAGAEAQLPLLAYAVPGLTVVS
jgi:hypothetical protein